MADESLKEELFHLRKKLSSVESLLATAEQTNSALESHNLQLQTQLKEKTSENEALQQSNYSLGLKLSSTEQTLQCCTAELESAQEQLDKQATQITTQLSNQHSKDAEALKKKAVMWEQQCELAEAEVAQLKERLSLSQQQLNEAQEALARASDVSICRDDQDLQAQVASLTCDKQQLEQEVASVSASRDSAEQQLQLAQHTLQQLNGQIEENECKLTSYYNQVERLKERQTELEQEVEMYKLTEKDPKTKGNSLFAEVVDQRHFVEQQYLKLRNYYELVSKQYRLKARQVAQLKLQVASLLVLTGSREDSEYVTHLNASLRIARSQILTLQTQITEMTKRIKTQQESPLVINCQPGGCASRSTFFQRTFDANQKDLSEARALLQEQRFNAVVLGEQMLQVQRRLNASEKCLAESKAECIRLTVQLQDIQAEKGIFTEYDRNETRVELLPGHADYKEPPASKTENGSDAKPNECDAGFAKSEASADKEDRDPKAVSAKSNTLVSSSESSVDSSNKTDVLASNSRPWLSASISSLEPTTLAFSLSSTKSSVIEKKPMPSSIYPHANGSTSVLDSTSAPNSAVPVSDGSAVNSPNGCTVVVAQSDRSPNDPSTKRKHNPEQDTAGNKRLPTEDDAFKGALSDNKENTPVALPPCLVSSSSGGNRKPKKSVRMQETVDVLLCDGDERSTTEVTKVHDGSGEKIRRVPRRMVPPPPTTSFPEMPADCKQQ